MLEDEITPISIPATVAGQTFATGPVRLMGWALKESTGAAAAAFELYDGTDATGQSLAPVTLITNESIRDWFGAKGVLCQRGLFISVTAGSVRGTLYVQLQPQSAVLDVLPTSAE